MIDILRIAFDTNDSIDGFEAELLACVAHKP